MRETPQWMVHEEELASRREYADDSSSGRVQVIFTAPSGKQRSVDGFWDGGRTWRARFMPDEVGEWHWRSECDDTADSGLHARSGAFQCVPGRGGNPLLQHGAIRVARNGRHFEHADGTPFLWLGDTCWNGLIRATAPHWERYLTARRDQGFTAIYFFTAHWRGLEHDPFGDTAFTGDDPIRINPQYFQRLDPKLAAINQHGLLATAIIVLALLDSDHGWRLPEQEVVRFCRYVVARWGAYHMIWTLGGDGDFRGERSERWRRIGRAVFDREHGPATMHPCGVNLCADEFRDEPWFDFISYQSCHSDSLDDMRWFITEPAAEWLKPPPRPIINFEPNYEDHPAYDTKRPFNDHDVRRAAYWSLLISPTAGVSYGNHNVWPWPTEVEDMSKAIPGADWRALGPWTKGLDTPGTRSITVLRKLFDSGKWWRLRPAPALLAKQAGGEDPRRFIAAAATESADWCIVYTPAGGTITLRTGKLARPAAARWFDPRRGEWQDAGSIEGEEQTFNTPDAQDWVLDIRASGP